MMERNGSGGMKIESRSPMIASGVATPKQASNNMTTVIAMAATSPARHPARSALERLMIRNDYRVVEALVPSA
jgi:hypothetical protein